MAYINSTILNDLQVKGAFDESRNPELGMVNAVKASTPATSRYIPNKTREAFRSISGMRNVEMPLIKDGEVTVVTTPGFNNIPNNLIETDKYNYVAYDVFSGFRFFPASFENNMVDAEEALANRIEQVSYGMGKTVEQILIARAEERKSQILDYTTQVSQNEGTFSFNASTDTLSLNKAAQKDTMYFQLTELMAANELPGQYRIVTSPGGLITPRAEAAKYGAANEQNKQALGFFGADRMHTSYQLSAGSDIFQGYMFRDGAMGVYENFPYDFRNGTKINGKEWSVSDMEIPYARMRANVYTNSDATNSESLITPGKDTNLTMTHFEEMAMWLRFYVVYDPNTELATRSNDIVKLAGLTS